MERAFEQGYVIPEPPAHRTAKRVAVVGSGPAGLAAAQQFNRAGHLVTVIEKSDRIGGLLRYGIPDFKMEKWVIDRRLEQLRAEGVEFKTNVNVGVDLAADELLKHFDAVLLACGAEQPRDIVIPGPRTERNSFCDGLPDAAEQARRGRPDGGGRTDSRHRQARGHHRRRRHRGRLPRHSASAESHCRYGSCRYTRCRPIRAPRTRHGRYGR